MNFTDSVILNSTDLSCTLHGSLPMLDFITHTGHWKNPDLLSFADHPNADCITDQMIHCIVSPTVSSEQYLKC